MVKSYIEGFNVYNEKMKDEYLNEMIESSHISEESSRNYARIFSVTFNKEKELSKDLSQFTFEEMEAILEGFEANNRNTVESYARIISSYLKWCVKKGYSEINVLEDIKPDDFVKYLTNKEIYFQDKELRRYEDACENYQDAVIIRLLFEGVGGKQFSELRNLKKEHIDFKLGRIKLISTLKEDEVGTPTKFTERYLDVSERTLTLINGALNQKIYVKKNGMLNQTDSNNIRPYTDLVNNDYVLRASITKTDNWIQQVDRYVIYRRIATISECLGIENLTAKYIQRSGMIYYAHKIMDDSNSDELSLEDIKMVANRFDIKSVHNLKGFLTAENVLKTYPQKK